MTTYRIRDSGVDLTLFNKIFCNRADFRESAPIIMLSDEVFVKFEFYGGLGAHMTFQDQHGQALVIPSQFQLKLWGVGKWEEVTETETFHANPQSYVLAYDISYKMYYENNLKLTMDKKESWALYR